MGAKDHVWGCRKKQGGTAMRDRLFSVVSLGIFVVILGCLHGASHWEAWSMGRYQES